MDSARVHTYRRSMPPGRAASTACVVLAGLAALWLGCSEQTTPPRAIVVISLDTLRADHLGCYGYARPTSPNIDALAAEGVLFERAISQASSTLPAHRALFQSREASLAGGAEPTLAELLGRAGFRTVAFTGGGNVSAAFGFGRGFERYVEDPRGFAHAFDAVELWLREHAGERFFLFLHSYDVHAPYDPPPPFDSVFYPDYAGPLTGRETRALLRSLAPRGEHASSAPARRLDEEDERKLVALYDGGILYADQFVGRLVLLLRELGIDDETALVLLSDHGEEFWEHGSVLHSHSLYQELVHVPLIFSLPGGRAAGARVAETVRLIDVAPTLLELLG
ncbi:MAG TPA: sulfatase, partial [Planctomycetota bacterium]|nr:sulfatase [Planctomycetota bacterium]